VKIRVAYQVSRTYLSEDMVIKLICFADLFKGLMFSSDIFNNSVNPKALR